MQAKSKSGKTQIAARGLCAKPKAGRGVIHQYDAWEGVAQMLEDPDDEIDCRRIVLRGGGRTLPVDDGGYD